MATSTKTKKKKTKPLMTLKICHTISIYLTGTVVFLLVLCFQEEKYIKFSFLAKRNKKAGNEKTRQRKCLQIFAKKKRVNETKQNKSTLMPRHWQLGGYRPTSQPTSHHLFM